MTQPAENPNFGRQASIKDSPSFRPLPDPSKLPYGLVRITVWSPNPDGGYSGKCYRACGAEWRNERMYADVLDEADTYHWSFDGFHLDYFNRGYIRSQERFDRKRVHPLVGMALWCLERWAVSTGLANDMSLTWTYNER